METSIVNAGVAVGSFIAGNVSASLVDVSYNHVWNKTTSLVDCSSMIPEKLPEKVTKYTGSFAKRSIKRSVVKQLIPMATTGLAHYANSMGISNAIAAASTIGVSPMVLGGAAIGVAGIAAGAAIAYACCRSKSRNEDMEQLEKALKQNNQTYGQGKKNQLSSEVALRKIKKTSTMKRKFKR
ncbi:MAG: hypothetical protein OXD32_03980 [Endozoicomonadaceae bacterium]|nr:hypothetical protein [Endozoicomonadaceae bacterium]MCY4330756.1 hypothetical protein [Endozoicomonadaceae bacterium]